MVLVNHECPKYFLPDSFEFNNFEYILPLFWKHEEYRNHFIEARKRGRFIILDNGLFERDSINEEELLEIYNLIEPDVFISPDAWNDWDTTFVNYLRWKEIVDPSKLMVILQSNTAEEARMLYKALVRDGVKYIGFNHLGQFYNDCSSHTDPTMRLTLGRIEFIHSLNLSNEVHHHLLGTNLAEEFRYYKDVPQIKSLDTSNPFMLAFEGKTYAEGNITSKPKIKMEDVFEFEPETTWGERVVERAFENIKYFKNNYK